MENVPLNVTDSDPSRPTYKQAVSIGLLEDTTDARHMLNGKAEQDKVHGGLTHQVIVLKISFHCLKYI